MAINNYKDIYKEYNNRHNLSSCVITARDFDICYTSLHYVSDRIIADWKFDNECAKATIIKKNNMMKKL